jgi:drug/metabolite transporter (DMT)-like permease|tara:strand:- start:593 stop:1477 length:885 start_codon:yes stop_codon:yes gene_type:complete
MSKNHLGVVYMIMSVLFFSFMDILIKITDEYAVGQVMFFRAVFGLIPIFFLIPKNRLRDFYKTKHVGLHFYRSFFGAIAMAAIFIGLRNLQLAEVTSLAFSGPIWVVIFSMIFLSEKIRAKRWVAVGLGFIGVLIISKPGFDNLNYYYIFPIIFCIGFAGVSILIRKLTLAGETVWLIAFYFSVASGLGGLATFPLGDWIMPTKYDLVLLILVGLLGGIANLTLTQSYKLAEVTLTTPLKYLSLVFAVIYGFYFFNEVPSINTLLGAGLIVISSGIIFFRENQLKKPIPLPRQQ